MVSSLFIPGKKILISLNLIFCVAVLATVEIGHWHRRRLLLMRLNSFNVYWTLPMHELSNEPCSWTIINLFMKYLHAMFDVHNDDDIHGMSEFITPFYVCLLWCVVYSCTCCGYLWHQSSQTDEKCRVLYLTLVFQSCAAPKQLIINLCGYVRGWHRQSVVFSVCFFLFLRVAPSIFSLFFTENARSCRL